MCESALLDAQLPADQQALEERLVDLQTLIAAAQAQSLAVVAELDRLLLVDDNGEIVGAKRRLRDLLRMSPPQATETVRLARQTSDQLTASRAALAAGE